MNKKKRKMKVPIVMDVKKKANKMFKKCEKTHYIQQKNSKIVLQNFKILAKESFWTHIRPTPKYNQPIITITIGYWSCLYSLRST